MTPREPAPGAPDAEPPPAGKPAETVADPAADQAAGPAADPDPVADPAARPVPAWRTPLRVLWRTITKAWTDGIFGMSAQGAFWQTLSLPPLLLGLLGGLGYIAGLFGPDTVAEVEAKVIAFCNRVFDSAVVEQIISPTVRDILSEGRGEIVTVGFVISLWAGSSAMSSIVDSITHAYGQREVRNTIWQRVFALLLYLAALVIGVLTLPVLALGPDLIVQITPGSWKASVATIVENFYYPTIGLMLVLALTTLYKLALPRKLPWHRGVPGALLAMACFLVTSSGLRLYITWITSTGYTYGALATPIAFLLFAFFIGFAVVLGAQLNNAIEEQWPAHMTQRERRRWRRLEMDKAAARMRAEEGDDSGAGGAALAHAPHTAPSPADTSHTTPLRREQPTVEVARPPAVTPGAQAPGGIVS